MTDKKILVQIRDKMVENLKYLKDTGALGVVCINCRIVEELCNKQLENGDD